MSYTVSQLEEDDRFKGMPKHAVEIFVAAFNAALEQYGEEERAFKIAFAAVKRKYRKEDDQWVEMSVEAAAEPTVSDIDTVLDAALGEGRVVLMSNSAATDEAPIERDAKIFEAGLYDDKDIEVSEADLDRMVKAHEPAPIGYEHAGGKLRFGWLSKVWRSGKDLFGRLSFSPRAWETAKECGLNQLSVTIPRDKSRLYGVDLVAAPRVGDAAFEFTAVGFSVADSDTKPKEVTQMPEDTTQTGTVKHADPERAAVLADRLSRLPADQFERLCSATEKLESFNAVQDARAGKAADRVEMLVKQGQERAAKTLVSEFMADGKVTRAAKPYAEAILATMPYVEDETDAGAIVTFSVGDEKKTMHIAEAFVEFLKVMPATINFRELARVGGGDDAITPTIQAGLKMFGLTDEDYEKHVLSREGGK